MTWAEPARRGTAVAAALRRVTEPRQRAAIPAGPERRAGVLADAGPYPGGIMVTHANVPANARQAAQVLGGSAVVTRLPPSRVLPLAGEGRW